MGCGTGWCSGAQKAKAHVMTATDGNTPHSIVPHLIEVHRLARHGVWALDHQLDEGSVQAQPDSAATVREIDTRLLEQAERLEQRLGALGSAADRHASARTDVPPTTAPRVSVAMGGDQAFLQNLALAYLQLQSDGQAQGDQETASVALWCYEDTQRLIREELSRAHPRAAAADQAAEASHSPPGTRH
jgi:hypothetical protein